MSAVIKESFDNPKLQIIAQHYENRWERPFLVKQWVKGPYQQLPSEFSVLEFQPTTKRTLWTYATCGMSQQAEAHKLELHLFSPIQSDELVELLTAAAHYHLTGDYLDLGHTVNFGRPWLPYSACEYGFISLPYLDGSSLQWLDEQNLKVQFLWLIPITLAERDFKKNQGIEALEKHFEESNFHYANPTRISVV
jgi:hypothetical protein